MVAGIGKHRAWAVVAVAVRMGKVARGLGREESDDGVWRAMVEIGRAHV